MTFFAAAMWARVASAVMFACQPSVDVKGCG